MNLRYLSVLLSPTGTEVSFKSPFQKLKGVTNIAIDTQKLFTKLIQLLERKDTDFTTLKNNSL